jgi:uncharacterized protein (TIGR02246 family)
VIRFCHANVSFREEISMQTPDETAIRQVMAEWLAATAAADPARLRPLLAEDVIFLTPGQPPMQGREFFLTGMASGLAQMDIQPAGEILELVVAGEWAWQRARLTVTVTPRHGGPTHRRSGETLTILHREAGGRWVIARDANLLAVVE